MEKNRFEKLAGLFGRVCSSGAKRAVLPTGALFHQRSVHPSKRQQGTSKQLAIWLVMLGAACLTPVVRGAGAERPNVIVILMDDLGWNNVGYAGTKFYETPNIDRLSARGMTFTHAYAAPICSPSRASILSGRDPASTGLTSPRGGDPLEVLQAHVQPRLYTREELSRNWRELPGGMLAAPLNQRALQVVSTSRLPTHPPSIGKLFKANGYATAHFGKWHVGPEPFSPLQHGFDLDVPHLNTPGPPQPGHFGPWPDWEEEKGPEAKDRQVDDVLADHAIKFIRANKDRPFYMNFWTYGVHIPFQAQKELVAYFWRKADPKAGQRNPIHAAMVKHTDAAIGRLWEAVEAAGLAEKTVLVFYSDNGAGIKAMHGFAKLYGLPEGIPVTDNAPLRGGKGDVYEGGVRVPAFILWPGVTRPGARCDLPLTTSDLLPTLAEICGLKELPKFDGRSVVPALAGKPMAARPVFTHMPQYNWGEQAPVTTVMLNGWKLLRFYCDRPDQSHRYELYNLKDDIGETMDCHRSHPDIVAKLSHLMDEYLKQTGAVAPIPNPDYKGALKGEFDGVRYELLDPVIKRGAKFPLVVCIGGGDGNPAYEELSKGVNQSKHPMYLLAVTLSAGGEEKVVAVVRKVVEQHPVQARQIYVTGQGPSAVAAWELAWRHPELFAAMLPVDATAAPEAAAPAVELPVWAFTNEHNPAAATLRQRIAALTMAGASAVKYTEFAQAEQVRFDGVWNDPEVLDWLFAQVQPLPRSKGVKDK